MNKYSSEQLLNGILKYNALSIPKQNTATIRQKVNKLMKEFESREDKNNWLSMFLTELIKQGGPKHRDVLHFYIRVYLGYNIPRKKICPEHGSPFAFISDMFFERVRNSVAFANRTGGKTMNIALLNQCDMAFKEGCEIASAGSTKDQAGKMYRYFTGFHIANQILYSLYAREPIKQFSEYKNLSSIEIITGSVKGLNSPHPNKARIDEVELMDWEVLQEGLSMSMSTDKVMGQNTFSCITGDTLLETSKGVFSIFDLINIKNKGNIKCYNLYNNKFQFSKINKIWKTKIDKVYLIKYKWFDTNRNEKFGELKCTSDHLILTKQHLYFETIKNYAWEYSWKQAIDLKIDQVLLNNHTIVSVEYYGVEDVYDIEVEKYHNFVTGDGLVLHNSTRKYESGTMQRLLDLAEAQSKKSKGFFKIYSWCIWEVLERCNRDCKADPVYGLCPILEVCNGKAKKCAGYYKLDDFIDKAVLLDKDILEAQWFNKRPSRQIYVYGDYWDRTVHYIPRKELTGEVHKIGALDFGSSPGHPFVFKIYLCDCTNFKKAVERSEPDEIIREKVKYYLSYEYRSGKATMEEHANRIKDATGYYKGMPIWADPSASQERIDLQDLYGIETFEADNAVETGIEKVRSHLQLYRGQANYYIFDDYLDCNELELVGTDVEFERYKYKRTKEGQINKKEPMKMDDHGMDCDRYAISSSMVYFREMFTPINETMESDFWR